ncbi:MAG: leucine-rich repeat protein, partial [Oscillospiraceae bacterium]|nr:leucine-rich repeat protein [Oscillospiraceae bacterium]
PAAVKTIEESAFEGNPAMRVVYVHDACTAIGANAFKDCTGLTQIRLPQNCAIDGTAFTGCDGLIAVYAPAGGTTEAWANNSGIPFVAE